MRLTKANFFLGCLVGGMGAAVPPLMNGFFATAHADTRLLPFQGRLTDSAGAAVADGAKVVEFKIYDAPTGGNVKWAGEVHKLSVNGGLVSTMLGSKAGLGAVDFSTPTFLQITVDANGDGQITAADPPLLPRQNVIPSIYSSEAGNARQLAGADWSAVIVDGAGAASNSPTTGFIKGSKIQPGSLTANLLAPNSISSTAIADGAVNSAKVVDGSIVAVDLAAAVRESLVPPGTILPFGGATAPVGFLLCNGAAYSRTGTYAALFGTISSSFGAPNGTTFNVPDLRGQFLRGVDNQPDSTVLPSAINISTNAITITGHGFNRSSYPVQISNSGGALPAPLVAGTTYYVTELTTNTFKLATSEANALANTPVDITTQGTGTHKIVPWVDPDRTSRGAMAIGGGIGGAIGSVQGDEFKSHTHQADWIFHAHVTPPMDLQIDNAASRWRATKSNTSATGGNETRPKNAYVNYIIKY